MAKRLPPISNIDLEEAIDVDVIKEKEQWNVYELEDGTIMKVKLVLRGVKRLKKWNPDGSPIYFFQSQNIVKLTKVPKTLQKRPKSDSWALQSKNNYERIVD